MELNSYDRSYAPFTKVRRCDWSTLFAYWSSDKKGYLAEQGRGVQDIQGPKKLCGLGSEGTEGVLRE